MGPLSTKDIQIQNQERGGINISSETLETWYENVQICMSKKYEKK